METNLMRPDHGKYHSGKYVALVRVSTDKQDVKNQMHGIKQYLNGGDYEIEWFKEEGISGKTPFKDRPVLLSAIRYAKKHKATLIVYSLSRLGRRRGDVLNLFDDMVSSQKIKFICVDMPMLDETTVGFMAIMSQHERKNISDRTKVALSRIKQEIVDFGFHTTKEGNKITKLGRNINEINDQGRQAQKDKADIFSENYYANVLHLKNQGFSYREIAMDFNRRGYRTRRGGDWHFSTIRNLYLRATKSLDNTANNINEDKK